MPSLRHTAEYAVARLAAAIVPRLSRGAVLALARFAGSTACLFARHLRRVGQANLDLAFGPEKTAAEKNAILRQSFRTFALAMLDTFWFSKDGPERTRRHVRFSPETGAHFPPGAAVCITAHMGNWEVLGMALVQRGEPLTSVAAPLDNLAVDELFNRMRRANGQKVVSKHGALRHLLRALKDGEKVALVLDQNTKPAEGGLFVDFFTLPVPVSSAAAGLALRTGAPVFLGVCLPAPDGSYDVSDALRVDPPPAPGGNEAERLHAFTQRITRAVEDFVRAHPEYWLWTYKRWKYVAPGRKREEYPFYAKELPQADT